MKKIIVASLAILFCLLLLNIPAAEKDAPGCKRTARSLRGSRDIT